jgi:hypothetical protein
MVKPIGHSLICLLLIATAAAFATPVTAAIVIPDMRWTVGGVSNVAFGNETVSLANPPVPDVSIVRAGGSASLQFSPTPSPAVTAFATGYDLAADLGAFAQGVFQYYGVLETPGGVVGTGLLPVVATGSLASQASSTNNGSNAQARLTVDGINIIVGGTGDLPASMRSMQAGSSSTHRAVVVFPMTRGRLSSSRR